MMMMNLEDKPSPKRDDAVHKMRDFIIKKVFYKLNIRYSLTQDWKQEEILWNEIKSVRKIVIL